jgi:hypothetical protein
MYARTEDIQERHARPNTILDKYDQAVEEVGLLGTRLYWRFYRNMVAGS